MEPILEFRDLYKMFGRNRAVNGINIKIYPGKIVGLLGPNGSGKTTIFKMIAGLLKATGGQILVGGLFPGIDSKSIVSYLPDNDFLDNKLSINECLNMYATFYEDFDMNRAMEMIGNLQLDKKARLRSLSKGNKEKVNLILAMSRKAKLYLLDEPIGGVDPAARSYIINTIINNYDPSATILISTHLISEIENILDEVIFLNRGQVMLYNSAENLRMEEKKSVDQIFREVFACY